MHPSTAWDPQRCRDLLSILARQIRLDPRWHRRFDASDLVQESVLKAYQNLEQFHGRSEAELVGWLQEIFRHTMADAMRRACAGKRDLAREQNLRLWLEQSSLGLEALGAGAEPSPSLALDREELRLRVAAALAQLPTDQGDVVILRDLLGTPVAEIAQRLGRSERAVAGLLLRGRRKLRGLLQNED